tara:strand:- start:382 stop:621 length:240 start_codon:yes stop_codon:yes gene_type:complete
MKKLLLVITLLAVTFVWYGFQDGIVKETTYIENSSNLPPANLTGADLTGANLRGVNLDGVILCNTIMPNGSINNSSCKK